MKASTKEQILRSLCWEAETDSVGGGMTKSEVWAKLRLVEARTKKAAVVEIGKMFGFPEDQIENVKACL